MVILKRKNEVTIREETKDCYSPSHDIHPSSSIIDFYLLIIDFYLLEYSTPASVLGTLLLIAGIEPLTGLEVIVFRSSEE